MPLLREFYGPLKQLVDEKRRELKRADFTTEPTDELCSLGHPMVIRLGRNGRFLACSLYPEHKESRPLPGEELPAIAGAGDPCPECGATDGGVLVTRRGQFGPFAGCSRYPDCKYILKTGPEPPAPLPFTVTCPQCGEGHLATRRARRTGSLFWGCSRYPTCDFTTSREPVGAVHDTDDGPIAKAAATDPLTHQQLFAAVWGARMPETPNNTFGCTWGTCGERSNTIRSARASSRQSRASAIGSNPRAIHLDTPMPERPARRVSMHALRQWTRGSPSSCSRRSACTSSAARSTKRM